jgi:hypothetical protein
MQQMALRAGLGQLAELLKAPAAEAQRYVAGSVTEHGGRE